MSLRTEREKLTRGDVTRFCPPFFYVGSVCLVVQGQLHSVAEITLHGGRTAREKMGTVRGHRALYSKERYTYLATNRGPKVIAPHRASEPLGLIRQISHALAPESLPML